MRHDLLVPVHFKLHTADKFASKQHQDEIRGSLDADSQGFLE